MSTKRTKINRKTALAMLGVAATMAYATPNILSLGQAHAGSGGGPEGGRGFFSGIFGGGSLPRGFSEGGGTGFIIKDQVTKKECGDCHQPYGADALPQGSWKRIMADLPNHFGEDASLDEPTRKHIENYLVANAVKGDGPLRITEQGWFSSVHRGEARLRAGASWSNCAGCHQQRGWNPKR